MTLRARWTFVETLSEGSSILRMLQPSSPLVQTYVKWFLCVFRWMALFLMGQTHLISTARTSNSVCRQPGRDKATHSAGPPGQSHLYLVFSFGCHCATATTSGGKHLQAVVLVILSMAFGLVTLSTDFRNRNFSEERL